MKIAVLLSIFANVINISGSANILGVVLTPSISHQVVFRPIWKALSLRGHQVTVITSDPINDPNLTNLTEIDIHFSYKYMQQEGVQRVIMDEESNSVLRYINMYLSTIDVLADMTRDQLKSKDVQNLIKNDSLHFDVVMVEIMNPVLLAFGKRFDCPVIAMLTVDGLLLTHEAMGNPINPTAYPDIALPLEGGNLTFTERLQSFIHLITVKLIDRFLTRPTLDPVVRELFGENFPPIEEMMSNIDMLFLNTNPILASIRPKVPAVIYFGGGTHLETPKSLPKELQDYLDSAKQGFIYFSLGSNVKSKDIPEQLRRIIIETFSELSYKILWKFEADELPGKPENVKIMKWLPQQDVLRHPNIKLFITQGGLQSMEEAIFTHVPIVVMPFMGDQDTNAIKIVNRGYGLSVDRRTLTKELFKETILEVINNKKYRNRIKEIAELALDQPISGVDNALWWTEYVLRHKGAKHLRSPAIDMPWYQYLLLDVIAFLFGVIFIVLYVTYKIVKITLQFVRSSILKSKVKTN